MSIQTSSPGRRFSWRAAAVFTIALSSALMLVSGLVLVAAPSGRIARDIAWRLWGLDRSGWEVLHLAGSVLFVAVVLWHLLLHASMVKNLVWNAAGHSVSHRRELLVAVALVGLVATLAVLDLPPASWLGALMGYMRREFW
ncbi:DUF4405 domain-containing protein [Cereibacter azotoformans]|uniref:Uncharacterized protein DUF4405 n=2 Tax=Cereibacter TaxID=1653176 RepID=A0A2T5KAD9_9RHOB|nr:DUF4405 domain-containing protein [Cereibacter azotoformans]AXQ95219.1 DUF4405 domain-containing protein [Cereibacter sphaeroides]PTR19359.1 uncharacterized protein DUF4405 [Cereibacter azotoformans]UIJ32565.1 DUF4405 domain-containing protein [Cereibacter azotoformans]ULB11522.1 DUF4405 domain-containing protein [Cereibacter azotoformans]